MENDKLVRLSDVINFIKTSGWVDYPPNAEGMAEELTERIPAVDAVERGVFEQVAWERDIAVGQLSDIGKSFGEKMDDAAKMILSMIERGENNVHDPLFDTLTILEINALKRAYCALYAADNYAEVVRCRECRYFCKGENDSESWEWCDCWKKDCWEDCYCACGQRREDGDEA